MARMTLAEARTTLAELLQLLDVDGSPELLASMNRGIAIAQRTLAMTERWLIPVKRSTQATVIGRTIYPSPQRESLVAVGIQIDPSYPPAYLAGGIAMDDLPVSGSMVPQRYDTRVVQSVVSVTVGVGGSGYTNGAAVTFSAPADGWAATGVAVVSAGAITGITITDPGGGYTSAPTVTVPGGTGATLTAVLGDGSGLVLTPPPPQVYTLVIDYREVPPITLADGTRLVMDEMAVIYRAAIMIGPSSNSPRKDTIASEASDYMKGLRGAGRAGASFQPGSSAPTQSRPGMIMRNGRWYTA